MEKTEVQALISEAVAPLQAENKRLREQVSMTHAVPLVRELLADIMLPPIAKQKVLEAVVMAVPYDKDGEIDKKKLGDLVESEAKSWAATLISLGHGQDVRGFGARLTEAEVDKQLTEGGKAHEEAFEEAMGGICEIFVGPKQKGNELRKVARKAFKEGRAA